MKLSTGAFLTASVLLGLQARAESESCNDPSINLLELLFGSFVENLFTTLKVIGIIVLAWMGFNAGGGSVDAAPLVETVKLSTTAGERAFHLNSYPHFHFWRHEWSILSSSPIYFARARDGKN